MSIEIGEVQSALALAAQQHEIAFRSAKQVDLRERRSKSRNQRANVFGSHLVDLKPLAEQPIIFQSLGASFEVFEREQIRDAGHPRVRRLGHYHVEFLVSGVDKISAVV